MLQQGIFHTIKNRSHFTKCSWVINAIHTSVKSSFKEVRDINSLAEVLIQSPRKSIKGLPLTPAGFKLYLKELQQLHPYCKTHTSCLCVCPQSKIRVESGSEMFLFHCTKLYQHVAKTKKKKKITYDML